MIVQAYFRFSDEEFEPMVALSRPIVIGNIKLDRFQIVIRKDIDSLLQVEDDFDSLGFLTHQVPAGIFMIGLPKSQSLDIAFDQLPTPVGDSSYGCPPLSHELLREAWRNLRVHPSSALVIGVAAAETGLKTLIVELVPQNSWLIRELQSPPIEKLATKYLPTLPARCTLEGEVAGPEVYYESYRRWREVEKRHCAWTRRNANQR